MKKIFTVASIAVVLALAGCSPALEDVSGTITVTGAVATNLDEYGPTEPGETCWFGTDGPKYPDISAGAQVKLSNAAGEVIAISSLRNGGHLLGWTEFGTRIYSSSDEFVEDFCSFDFTFEQIALSDGIYSIEVASRGGVLYSKEDLLDGVSLSLGN
jgi:hypothetical protein